MFTSLKKVHWKTVESFEWSPAGGSVLMDLKMIMLILVTILAFGSTTTARKSTQWFLANSKEECKNVSSILRADNPVKLCNKVPEAILIPKKIMSVVRMERSTVLV